MDGQPAKSAAASSLSKLCRARYSMCRLTFPTFKSEGDNIYRSPECFLSLDTLASDEKPFGPHGDANRDIPEPHEAYVCMCMYMSMCPCADLHLVICMYACMHFCTYVCMYVCMYRYMNNTAYMSVPLVPKCTTRISTTGSPSGLCRTLVGLHGGLLIQLL